MNNHHSAIESSVDMSSFFAGALFGGLVGAGAMFLLVPQAIQRARAKIQPQSDPWEARARQLKADVLEKAHAKQQGKQARRAEQRAQLAAALAASKGAVKAAWK